MGKRARLVSTEVPPLAEITKGQWRGIKGLRKLLHLQQRTPSSYPPRDIIDVHMRTHGASSASPVFIPVYLINDITQQLEIINIKLQVEINNCTVLKSLFTMPRSQTNYVIITLNQIQLLFILLMLLL